MEKLYQYLWKQKMFGRELSIGGKPLKIIHPGVLNTHAGPDFSNARLLIDGTLWSGNVEIHVKASDWYRHHHDEDSAYDSVVLHVVAINDAQARRHDGTAIPQVEVTFPEQFYNIYMRLADNMETVRCAPMLGEIPQIVRTDWIESLSIERMQTKASRLLEMVCGLGGDWEQVCFISLSRALGFGLNGTPFEMLARSIPLNYIRRHGDNPFQIEAILFGQAGMLDTSLHIFDEYYQTLCREYFFLARKYGLRPMRNDIWKYARTRPQNFPHRRIAMLARYLTGGFRLLSEIVSSKGDDEIISHSYAKKLEGYWLTHSDFDLAGFGLGETLGRASLDLLMINHAGPLLYAYGASHGNPELSECGIDLWTSLRPERNMFVRQWEALGIKCRDASESQGLLHLRKEYCDRARCLECRWGGNLLRRTIK